VQVVTIERLNGMTMRSAAIAESWLILICRRRLN
jgi:hypothetical protein